MHEGFVRVRDIPETRAVGISGRVGRARGICSYGRYGKSDTHLTLASAPKFSARVPCTWVTNTCDCWPASGARCDECKAV